MYIVKRIIALYYELHTWYLMKVCWFYLHTSQEWVLKYIQNFCTGNWSQNTYPHICLCKYNVETMSHVKLFLTILAKFIIMLINVHYGEL